MTVDLRVEHSAGLMDVLWAVLMDAELAVDLVGMLVEWKVGLMEK